MAGGNDTVPHGDEGVRVEVGNFRPVGIVTRQNRARPRRADDDRNAEVEIGNEQHQRRPRRNAGNATDEAGGGNDGVALGDAVTGARADDQADGRRRRRCRR